MSKNAAAKIAAVMITVVLLANTLFASCIGVSAADTQLQTGNSASNGYINNANLMPKYVTDSQVVLEASDNGALQTPDWVKTLMITQMNVATASTDGKFSGMTKALDHLAEMGVNGIWLTPINDGAAGTSLYANYGPHTISTSLTGTENYADGWNAVKAFVDQAHARNIRVFLDIITWGTSKDSPLYTEHPDWYNGSEVYGGWAYDWSNTELSGWFAAQMKNMIMTTGADGFRADCGTQFSGSQLFKTVRTQLLAEGRKIAMFSECAETRDGTFDFEEHSVTNTLDNNSIYWDTSKFYTEKFNIVDAVKNGTSLGTTDLLSAGQGGKGRFYSSLISCHDSTGYAAENDIITMGYAGILSPFIPIWYLGEEWNNTLNSSSGQLYRTTIDWSKIQSNRDYFEQIKSMIRIRRLYTGMFENSPQNHRDINLCKVSTNSAGLLQAYARYYDSKAILVVPNNSDTSRILNITVPYSEAGLANTKHQVTDMLKGAVITEGTPETMAEFTDEIGAGQVGVYLVEKSTKLTAASLSYNASYENEPHWVIQLEADQDITVGNGDYWSRNLQQIASNATEEHNALAAIIRANIFVNGISVEQGLTSATDKATSTRIKAVGNKLTIAIDAADNAYGINNQTGFLVEVKDGISLNGLKIASACFEYLPLSNKFLCYNTPTGFVNAEYADGQIVLTADRYIGTDSAALKTAANGKISINGTAVTEMIASGRKLIIPYSATAGFNIYIKEGIILNGYEFKPTRYNCTVSAAKFTGVQGEYITQVDDPAGANLTTAYISEKSGGNCSNHAQAEWIIDLTFDKNILSGLVGYYERHLQVDPTLKDMICNNILINGKTVSESIANAADKHTAVHIKTSGKVLEIAIPKNNGYSFDGNGQFEITILSGLSFSGVKVNPRKVTHLSGSTSLSFSKIDSVFSTEGVTAAGASYTLGNIQSKETGYCTSHGATYDPAQWIVDIYFDKEISSGYANYWNNHLQSYTQTAGIIGSKILINGKTIAQCIEEDGRDAYTAIHLRTSGKALQIAIPKDNGYGFNGNSDFKIEIRSGITLNNTQVNPCIVDYKPLNVDFLIPEITVNRVKFDTSTYPDFYLYFDKSYELIIPNNTLQDPTYHTSAVRIQTALDFCKSVKINGMNINQGNLSAKNYYSVQISLIGTAMRFHFNDSNNVYGVKQQEDFTAEFTKGFMLDGYRVVPKVCYSNGSISSGNSGYWPIIETMTNGSVVPRNTAGAWVANSMTVAKGETIRAIVSPSAGYQLKAGSLKYSYWYNGVKQVKAIAESTNGLEYTFQSPDVVGRLSAQFVEIGKTVNAAPLGVQKKVSGTSGMRFVTRMYLDNINLTEGTVTLEGKTYPISGYGTLIGFSGEQLTVDNAVKCQAEIYRTNSKFVDFTASVVNIPDSLADTEIQAAGYLQYECDGVTTTVYTDSVVRSANSN